MRHRLNLVCWILLWVSMAALVTAQYRYRKVFYLHEKAQQAKSALQAEYERLVLSSRQQRLPVRIDRFAREQLQLAYPDLAQVYNIVEFTSDGSTDSK